MSYAWLSGCDRNRICRDYEALLPSRVTGSYGLNDFSRYTEQFPWIACGTRFLVRPGRSVVLGFDLQAKNDHEDDCKGTCLVCVQTRRMVSAVVAGSINEIITYLGQEDLENAQKHASALLAVLGEVPPSTAALIGDRSFIDLRKVVEKGLWEITNGDVDAAGAALQAGLTAWYETYPPYEA